MRGGRGPAAPCPTGSLWIAAPDLGSLGRPASRTAGVVGVARVRPGDSVRDDATPVPGQDAERPQQRGLSQHLHSVYHPHTQGDAFL